MTKQIRIENADMSSFKVRAYIENLSGGQWVREPFVTELNYPTDLASLYITSTRRIVIEECED